MVEAEQRGAKAKKKLEIDPLHADTVRLIFDLALNGDGRSGPMGVKAIVSHLNRNRIYTREGGRWGIGQLHRVLTRRTYVGEHPFNSRSKSKQKKPESEVVVAVPPLIDTKVFNAVQEQLQARNPKIVPPRVVSGPTLLTGICYCAPLGVPSLGLKWRRGWDSNPRYACTHNGFRDRPDRPLRHLSIRGRGVSRAEEWAP